MRTRQLLAFLPALTLAPALLVPAAALVTETQTIHFPYTESRAELNPVPARPGR